MTARLDPETGGWDPAGDEPEDPEAIEQRLLETEDQEYERLRDLDRYERALDDGARGR